MPGEAMLPGMGAGNPPVQAGEAPSQEMEMLDMMVEQIMDMWRRTGEISGMPIGNQEEAIQVAHQVALEHLAQIRHANQQPAEGAVQGGQGNPMIQALMGGM